MLPIMVDLSSVEVALIGAGPRALARFALLRASGVGRLRVFAPAGDAALQEASGAAFLARPPEVPELAECGLVFIAGIDKADAETYAAAAREGGALVNTEDVKPLCDFHVPALVRRGDLIFTVSTGGASPALARLLKEDIETRYGLQWAERSRTVADWRAAWRAEGASMKQIAERTKAALTEQGWL